MRPVTPSYGIRACMDGWEIVRLSDWRVVGEAPSAYRATQRALAMEREAACAS